MASGLIRREIEKIIILSLREIFKHSVSFTYDDDDTLTKILITPRYAITDTDSKPPQIIVSGISYGLNKQSIFNNFDNYDVLSASETHRTPFSFNTELTVLSTIDGESEGIADTLVNIFDHDFADLFNAQGLNIQSISSAPVTVTKPYPQYEFATGVSLSGEAMLTWTSRPADPLILHKIKLQYPIYMK